jgi:hypothetical protein
LPGRTIATSIFLVACALGAARPTAHAQSVTRTPLDAGHPLIGVWRLDVPGTDCHEIYDVRADGTSSVTSGAQVGETEFEISARPSAKGFYKWVDRITRDNGKPDCAGSSMEVGHVSTHYILVHRSGKRFAACTTEDLVLCIGPFVRLDTT